MRVDDVDVKHYQHRMSKKDQVIALADGTRTARDIADEVGVSKQYVHQVVKPLGLPIATWEQNHKVIRNPYRWGLPVSNNWIGAACELTAAVDLITKGWLVYHSMSRCGPFDLAGYKDGKFIRVEVKAVRTRSQDRLKVDQADHLARVMPDGEVIWHPPLPE